MNNSIFGKTKENIRKHKGIKLITTERKRIHLVPKPNYHTRKWFSENLLAIGINITKVVMNNSVHSGLSISDMKKMVMLKYWCDYAKLMETVPNYVTPIQTPSKYLQN